MSVYVDASKVRKPRNVAAEYAGRRWEQQWCHLWADSEEELRAFAGSIGCSQRWIHVSKGRVHFDLTPSFRRKAVSAGAVEIEFKDWIRNRRTETRT